MRGDQELKLRLLFVDDFQVVLDLLFDRVLVAWAHFWCPLDAVALLLDIALHLQWAHSRVVYRVFHLLVAAVPQNWLLLHLANLLLVLVLLLLQLYLLTVGAFVVISLLHLCRSIEALVVIQVNFLPRKDNHFIFLDHGLGFEEFWLQRDLLLNLSWVSIGGVDLGIVLGNLATSFVGVSG